MSMDEAIALIKRFIQDEYEALIATYTEFDDAVLSEKVRRAEQHLHITPSHIMSLGFGRAPGTSREEIEEKAHIASRRRPRVLFQGKHYKHHKIGDLYRFYVSSYLETPLLSYESCYFISEIDGALKIISRYGLGFALDAGDLDWEHSSGTEIGEMGELLEVRKFIEPKRRAHLAEYQAE